MSTKKTAKSAAIKHLHDRYVGTDPERLASLEEERTNAYIARTIYELRTAAGLTQQNLADLVETTASVICRLEDAEYEGHSLSMLRRIAKALHCRIEIRFIEDDEQEAA